MLHARRRAKERLLLHFEKIFDRRQGRFYCAHVGPSQLLPRQSWVFPRVLRRRGFRQVQLRIIYSDGEASDRDRDSDSTQADT